MDQLPSLKDYTPQEKELAFQLSPAIKRYWELKEKEPFPHGQRHKAWIQSAMATLLNKAPAQKVCHYWSLATRQILQKVWSQMECPSPACVFAVGKLGANELNLSSDIDLVFVTQDKKNSLPTFRKFVHTLSSQTEKGFCYRIDLDLRPGGRLGPLLTSPKELEDYYWSQGSTWERVALVRWSYVCGDPSLAQEVTRIIQPFVYRKYIDFSLYDSLKELRSAQRHHHSSQNGIHLKLDPGGIRDVELFINSLQVIHGGRHPELQTTSTTKAAQILMQKQLFDTKILQQLLQHYWKLRDLENKVQSIEDRQTHLLESQNLFQNLSREELLQQMKQCEEFISHLLGKEASTPFPTSLEDQKKWLIELGFSSTSSSQIWPQIIQKTTPLQQGEHAEKSRQIFLFNFVKNLAQINADKDLGLHLLLNFIQHTRAKHSFFSLLNHNPALRKELARLFSSTPYLGGILAERPELLDSYFYRQMDHLEEKDFEDFLTSLLEKKQLTEILASQQFLKDFNVITLAHILSSSADEITLKLLNRLKKEYGKSQIEILPLGKWGGQELGLKSDLDFIFVLPDSPQTKDIRIAKRLISRLTEVQRGGALFQVDLRLRPSGQAGPLLLSQESLISYLKTQAPFWLKQSYLKIRALNPNLSTLTQTIKTLCLEQKPTISDLQELSHIRSQLLKPSTLDFKYAPGGLIDIEFDIQILLLKQQILPQHSSTPEMILSLISQNPSLKEILEALQTIYLDLRTQEQIYQLVSGYKSSKINPQSETLKRMARLQNLSPEEALKKIQKLLEQGRHYLTLLRSQS